MNRLSCRTGFRGHRGLSGGRLTKRGCLNGGKQMVPEPRISPTHHTSECVYVYGSLKDAVRYSVVREMCLVLRPTGHSPVPAKFDFRTVNNTSNVRRWFIAYIELHSALFHQHPAQRVSNGMGFIMDLVRCCRQVRLCTFQLGGVVRTRDRGLLNDRGLRFGFWECLLLPCKRVNRARKCTEGMKDRQGDLERQCARQ